MKVKINKVLFVLVFILGMNLSAQDKVIVQLNVFEQLSEISFAAFMTANGLENTPRIFQVLMTPHGKNIIVKGAIRWRRVNKGGYSDLYTFTTKPFTSRNFYNDDLSSIDGIKMETSESNNDLLDENLKIGKPSGSYEIVIKVYDENMGFKSEDAKFLGMSIPSGVLGKEIPVGFPNPSQTFSILTPGDGDKLDAGGINLSWTNELGIFDFIVKANIRVGDESPEEALQRGNPIVDNRPVGMRTNVNFREPNFLSRELVGGEEIVVQVRGTIKGPGGPSIVYSEIINFFITSPGNTAVDRGIQDFENLVQDVMDDWKEEGQADSDAYKVLENLLSDLQNGIISFEDIKIRNDRGQLLTYAEFQQILEYLRRNPDLLTNLLFESK
jgi:hypothetical protein